MSTTELVPSAGDGAVSAETQGDTSLPEQQTAGDAHQQDGAESGADESQGSGKPKQELTPEQRTIKRLEDSIGRQRAKRGAAERETELLRQRIAELERGAAAGGDEDGETGKGRQFTEADIDRVATQKAAEIAHQGVIRDKVSKVIKEGSKLEGFNAAVDAVAEVVPFRDRSGKPTPFIEAVLDGDNPAALLKYLGDNPEEAEELADLSPMQLGRRLERLETRLTGAKKTVSDAPTPLKPVRSASAGIAPVRSPEDLMQQLRALR